ncbi:MAG: dihydroorotate dehydrogenase electron transfer subunit [Tannerellaceae bacterium]|jgi:dihydroorotate dehydrogenase electron transfer subunit|nr:dihydroorotate dehydrogenase electron transfer subunit [Tannerellaceae bacterium]
MKRLLDLTVTENLRLGEHHGRLELTADEPLPEMRPGQFIMLRIDKSPHTFLRRPISIHFVDTRANTLRLLVRRTGEGTEHLFRYAVGERINALLPLGNGFTLPEATAERILLVGGGVGIAPLLFLADTLLKRGCRPDILMGAQTTAELLQTDTLRRTGNLHIATDDGSYGHHGRLDTHSILRAPFDRLYACGPKPMLVSLVALVGGKIPFCEVSLENTMACGLGACLCCVEKLADGHNACVCTEGPVFNVNQLPWLN